MFEEIADGVFAAPHRIVEGKAAVVFGKRHALAIDACNDPGEGQEMVDFIVSHGFRPDHLLYTHGHADHVMGSPAFEQAGAVACGHRRCVAQMERTVERVVARDGGDAITIAASLCWPAVVVRDEWSIDLGDRVVTALRTPGHSDDSICAWLPDERLLIGGDTVVTVIPPSIADGNSSELEASLQRLLDLEPSTVLPGHGSPVYGSVDVSAALNVELEYVRLVGRLVTERGEQLPDEIVSAIVTATHGQFPIDRHHMPTRHRNVVDKMLEEHRVGERLPGTAAG